MFRSRFAWQLATFLLLAAWSTLAATTARAQTGTGSSFSPPPLVPPREDHVPTDRVMSIGTFFSVGLGVPAISMNLHPRATPAVAGEPVSSRGRRAGRFRRRASIGRGGELLTPRPPGAWIAVALSFALVVSGGAGAAHAAASPRTPEGHWQVSLPGMPRLALHFERRDGRLLGTLDSPDQGAMGLPLDSVTFVRDSLRCEFRAAQVVFAARLSAGGDSLIGTWSQAGMGLPLTLTRGRFAPARRPQEPVPPYPYDTLAVAFINPNAAGVRLSGTLTLPKGKGPFPAALLITGSGQQDRDETAYEHRPFKVLADHLTRNGIAVLRVDDRGVGGSTGPITTATSEDFASDALASVEYLARRAEVRRDAVGLIGHSEGGLIAPLVAWRAKQVSFVVLLAGPGIPCDSLMLLQTAASRRAIGVTEAQLAKEKVASRRLYAAIRAGDSSGVVAATRELVTVQLSALPESERAGAGDPATLAAGAVHQLWNPWMRYFVSYDPAPALHRLRCPVLALNGSRDLQVTPRENLAGIEAALKHGGNKDFTVRELPGLNHLFQTCRTCTLAEYITLQETFAPAALETISTWIQERVGRKK